MNVSLVVMSSIAMSAVAILSQLAGTAPQPSVPEPAVARAQVPFGVGERMDYQVKFGAFSVGKAHMMVKAVENIRGRPAWNVEMHVDGGVPLYRMKSTFTSWLDTLTLASLRFTSDQLERGRARERYYDIFPDRAVYRQKISPDTLSEVPSVPDPLDDASFLYFVRTTPLEVGRTYTFNRYFRPDRNPVIIKVLERDTVSVPLGEFPAIVIQPIIIANGIFGEGGEAKVWLSDDPSRIVLKIESKVTSIGSLHLNLTGYAPPTRRR